MRAYSKEYLDDVVENQGEFLRLLSVALQSDERKDAVKQMVEKDMAKQMF